MAGTGLGTVLHTQQADLDSFDFEMPADLVLAFSVIEHLPDADAIRDLDVIYQRRRPAEVDEERDGESYTLSSTLVTSLLRRPAI